MSYSGSNSLDEEKCEARRRIQNTWELRTGLFSLNPENSYHTICFADPSREIWGDDSSTDEELNDLLLGFLDPYQYFGYNDDAMIIAEADKYSNILYEGQEGSPTYRAIPFPYGFQANLFGGKFQGGVVHYDSCGRFSNIWQDVKSVLESIAFYVAANPGTPVVFAMTTLVKCNLSPSPETSSDMRKLMNKCLTSKVGWREGATGNYRSMKLAKVAPHSNPVYHEYRNNMSTMRQTIITF